MKKRYNPPRTPHHTSLFSKQRAASLGIGSGVHNQGNWLWDDLIAWQAEESCHEALIRGRDQRWTMQRSSETGVQRWKEAAIGAGVSL